MQIPVVGVSRSTDSFARVRDLNAVLRVEIVTVAHPPVVRAAMFFRRAHPYEAL